MKRRLGRKRHIKDGEQRDEAWIDVVPTSTRLTHCCHVVDVLHRLPVQILTWTMHQTFLCINALIGATEAICVAAYCSFVSCFTMFTNYHDSREYVQLL